MCWTTGSGPNMNPLKSSPICPSRWGNVHEPMAVPWVDWIACAFETTPTPPPQPHKPGPAVRPSCERTTVGPKKRGTTPTCSVIPQRHDEADP
jgi:hypothetical protein